MLGLVHTSAWTGPAFASRASLGSPICCAMLSKASVSVPAARQRRVLEKNRKIDTCLSQQDACKQSCKRCYRRKNKGQLELCYSVAKILCHTEQRTRSFGDTTHAGTDSYYIYRHACAFERTLRSGCRRLRTLGNQQLEKSPVNTKLNSGGMCVHLAGQS